MARKKQPRLPKVVEYCVYTNPPGQTPAKRVKCFKTKLAAKHWARRGPYQVITQRAWKAAGWTGDLES